MQIVETYSHLNGLEYLLVHKPKLWQEIQEVVFSINAEQCRTKLSQEKRSAGKLFYSPVELNRQFKEKLIAKLWQESRVNYWVTSDRKLIQKTMGFPAKEQKEQILKAGLTPIASYNQTDFVKERVAIEVQFGKYAFVAYDLFVKHLAFFISDAIDVGIEILAMKSLQTQMSSGPAYYEGELYNVLRQGRGVPAVPLVIIGVAA